MCGIFMEKEQIREKLASAASMPKDVVLGASVVTMLGRNEVSIENYRGIIEYTDTLIRVQTKSGQIRLTGKRLQVEYYTNDEMKITGAVHTLEFIDGRKED
ncbi:MAG TPA: YabP/YqfC family sporulation protein [Candidatus Mediterraneibacter faecigallinarum]|jgi:sporulation protein YqfC|uniref:YabP/YqfC family sporulation protein n=1 Tax=Candidatus Mediterraneibacter faecigallinarum TaxID=2838669 RepID=A0A9D2NTV7_9FIRM|nr:YabP/YqfC family sporulation protein [Candidatus Mediterraneibacter faecigallinarum]